MRHQPVNRSSVQSSLASSRQVHQASRALVPEPVTHPTLQLQQQVGNRAVGSLLQAKLTIGQPNDPYEKEADRIAAQVVDRIHTPALQPQTLDDDEKTLQAKPHPIQRQPGEDELQMQPQVQWQPNGSGVTSDTLATTIQTARGHGQPLIPNIQTSMSQAFGADFSQVKIHTDSQAHQLNQSIQARAFTTGQDIFFRRGEYQPHTRPGQTLLAHELTHVVQQQGSFQTFSLHRQPQPATKAPKSADATAQKQLETLLRSLPTDTPDGLGITMNLLSDLPILPSVTLPLNAFQLARQLKKGDYKSVAATLISLTGDVATATSFLTKAALRAGALSSTSKLALASRFLAGLGAAAPLINIAVSIAIATLSIPLEADANVRKAFYIANFSGILTSWIFNDKTISPHSRLIAEAKYDKSNSLSRDLLEGLNEAHQAVHRLWQQEFSKKPESIRQFRQAFYNDPIICWLSIGQLLENRMKPRPLGYATSFIKSLLNEYN